MKSFLTILCFLFCANLYCQEKFNHRYRFRPKILYAKTEIDFTKEQRKAAREKTLKEHRRMKKAVREIKKFKKDSKEYKAQLELMKVISSNTVKLSKNEVVPFIKLKEEEKKTIKSKIGLVKNNISETVELLALDKTKIVINKSQAGNKEIFNSIGLEVRRDAKIGDYGYAKYKGDVLFKEDKLFVNPWNFTNRNYPDTSLELFYPMSDGLSIKLNFQELTLTTLTLPIKYRFGNDPLTVPTYNDQGEPILDEQMLPVTEERLIPETFTTSINISFFFGYSFGRTNFLHKKKVGNRTTVHKHTIGVIAGTTAETLTKINTNGSNEAPKNSESLTIGLISPGFGYVYSRNKFSVGAFFGWDFGIGSVSNTWNYDKQPWLGVGIGYEIFKL
ncbi:MAG: WW domain binding protein 11 [Allomuricauda sp.]